MDDTKELLKQLTRMADSLESIDETLGVMVGEGLVVMPDVGHGDN